eukprot:gene2448-3158_t
MSKNSLLDEYKNELSMELDTAIEENTKPKSQSFVLKNKVDSNEDISSNSISQKGFDTNNENTWGEELFNPGVDISENWSSKERKEFKVVHNLLSLKGDMKIYDSFGGIYMTLVQKMLHIGPDISLFDKQKKLLGKIKKKVFSFKPYYSFFIDDVEVLRVQKTIKLLKMKVEFLLVQENEQVFLQVMNHNQYILKKNGETIAFVKKATLTDDYHIHIEPENNILLLLACSIIFDCIIREVL